MPEPIADQSVWWQCASCGTRTLRHLHACDHCGTARPEPPPEASPSDLSRPDVAFRRFSNEEWRAKIATGQKHLREWSDQLWHEWTEPELEALRKRAPLPLVINRLPR